MFTIIMVTTTIYIFHYNYFNTFPKNIFLFFLTLSFFSITNVYGHEKHMLLCMKLVPFHVHVVQ
jgi:hypothetical protein